MNRRIPARVGFADVKNHLATERLLKLIGTDLFTWHGYVSLLVDGRWVKATPVFNIEMCERFHVLPLDFDGTRDALMHPFNARNEKHMEYVCQRGEFDDLPFDEMAADMVRRFGIEPKLALLSHSNFGTSNQPTAVKMRRALELVLRRAPDLEVEGEMHGDAALAEDIRLKVFPSTRLRGQANLLIMPTLDAANIAFNLLKTAAGDGVTIGPILLGAARAVHILTPSATVRRIVNMTALAVVDANAPRAQEQSLF